MAHNRLSDIRANLIDDARLKRVNSVLSKYQRRPDSLIEVLHVVQESYGYIPLPMMRFVAQELRLPPSRLYGVVTFYHFFSTKPKGKHTCVLCTGTACHVKGSKAILSAIQKRFDVAVGEVTRDGELGLQTARCLGCCSLGPVAVVDDEIVAKTDAQGMLAILEKKVSSR